MIAEHCYGRFTLSSGRRPAAQFVYGPVSQIRVAVGLDQVSVKICANNIWTSPHKTYEATGKCVSVVPPDETYSGEYQRKGDVVFVDMDPGFVLWAAHEHVHGGTLRVTGRYLVRDPLVEQLAAALRVEFTDGVPPMLYAESLTIMLCTHLIRSYSEVSQSPLQFKGTFTPYWWRKAIDYIEAHLTSDISLSAIAAELKMSPHYFAEKFKNTAGFAPHSYVTKRRIELAKRLLANRDLKLADIAVTVGFANQNRFTEAFVRCVGMTPHRYRESM